ncbi:alpha/beta hydrolase [Sphingomonas sp. MG17]|uniref:Alpha/beta hydrolase n=1 Tax=Sphingomonas tagetis TaxID=2949092 RepID=A0A9X2HKE6_9SPHN|nr:alpha/beta hydrolase [Sphingomonas tagetis]MCP3730281.1 alpha/beta hydrolase [Sphingomonas tagetis]
MSFPHFETHFITIRDNVRLAYNHEGGGGVPLVMLHGWPGGKRLFWRNIGPLVAAGFEVIVPDQRGFGETPPVPGGPLSVQESARDIRALLESLGHDSCVLVGGDMGSGVSIQLLQSHPGLVKRFVTYNGFVPMIPEAYAAAGLPSSQFEVMAEISDHFALHALEADKLAAGFDSDEARLAYVKRYFQGHVWKEGGPMRHLAGPNRIDDSEAEFLAEQIKSETSFRAALNFYEGVMKPAPDAGEFLIDRPIDVETLVLWGMEDEIVGELYPSWMEVGCTDIVGPFLVRCGHFLQWEAADVLNSAVRSFCRDLLPQ